MVLSWGSRRSLRVNFILSLIGGTHQRTSAPLLFFVDVFALSVQALWLILSST
jgi:hypothetical protein